VAAFPAGNHLGGLHCDRRNTFSAGNYLTDREKTRRAAKGRSSMKTNQQRISKLLTDCRISLDDLRAIAKNPNGSANSTSLLTQIRAQMSASKDPAERTRLARRARELRGTMLEICSALPDEKTARSQAESEKDPRVRTILMKYANALRRFPKT
jgi:hypothetical protein